MSKTAQIDQYLKSKKVTAGTKITLALLIELLDGFKISQFQSSPKWVDELYLLQKSINAADPFGYDVLIKDLKKQIDSIISKAETRGNVSPQAPVVAEEKFFTTDEVWRMYSSDPAYGHKSYKEFAEENGWVMVRLKAAPTPTEEQIFDINGKQVKDGDCLVYIGTNMSGCEVRKLDGRLIVVGPFTAGYLSDWIAALDFQSIEIVEPESKPSLTEEQITKMAYDYAFNYHANEKNNQWPESDMDVLQKAFIAGYTAKQ